MSLLRNFDPEFVETRRRGLEGWIRRVAAIPDFAKSDAFVFFMSCETFSADVSVNANINIDYYNNVV